MSGSKDKIIDLLKEAQKRTVKKPPQKKPTAKADFYVNGNGNVVAGRDININKRVIRRLTITPSSDSVTPAQKQTIKEKITELADIGVIAGGKKEELFASWWHRLHRKFRVNSYHELSQADFEDVLKWLSMQRAMNRPKLRRRANMLWRKDMYKAIWSKAREIGMSKAWVYSVAEKRLGKKVNSLTELGERALKQLYDYIIRL